VSCLFYIAHCTFYFVLCALCFVLCALCFVLCALWELRRPLFKTRAADVLAQAGGPLRQPTRRPFRRRPLHLRALGERSGQTPPTSGAAWPTQLEGRQQTRVIAARRLTSCGPIAQRNLSSAQVVEMAAIKRSERRKKEKTRAR